MPPDASASIHATAIAVDGMGIVITGPSGSGKSRLALDMLFLAREAGRAAALVGDDRILLTRRGEVLIAQGHPAITGRIEARGHGILRVQTIQEARLHWHVILSADGERLPPAPRGVSHLLDVALPTFHVSSGLVPASALLLQMLHGPAFPQPD